MTGRPGSTGVDIGSANITIARDGGVPQTWPTPAGGWQAGVYAARASLEADAHRGGLCLAVPDRWLDGSVAGAGTLEELRHLAEDQLGVTPFGWTGQLAAVAALTASDRGPGRYLICDIGASGVRVAMADVDRTAAGGSPMVVTAIAAHQADGGWRDFDASLRARLAVDGRPLPADWFHGASSYQEDRRARMVLGRAAECADYADIRAYSLPGTDGAGIIAAELIECFADLRAGLTACLAAVRDERRPDVTVLTGGFSWFPLVAQTVAGAGTVVAAPPTAAAQGALLFASGQARYADAPPLTVSVPAHRIGSGQLQVADIPLDWTKPFAEPPGGPLHLEGDELMLTINGHPATVPLPGIVPGPHRIGIRRGWTGATALVVRPYGDGPFQVAALDVVTGR